MRTSTSGMNAQANRLGTVADNIANSNTAGYKKASTEFSTLVLQSGTSDYTPGSVETEVRYGISEQGGFEFTTSATDLAIRGTGFLLVADESGATYLTRAGAFVQNGNGDLVNTGGYTMMGYPVTGGVPNVVANGTAGLVPVNVGTLALQAEASTVGAFNVNLPSTATIVAAADLPSANAATATYTAKSSLVAYDNIGNQITLDVYASLSSANNWEITVFDQSQAAAPGAPFPYAAGPLVTTTLTFDPTTGGLDTVLPSPTTISIPIPNGQTLVLDMAQTSELPAPYQVLEATVDGNGPSAVDRIEIDDTGTLYAVYENGARTATYLIPLATVVSPDNLVPLAGNVFVPSSESGPLRVGFAGTAGFGALVPKALEKSTVDIASELTTMIEAQNIYTANSKVFQTAADLMEVLINLKR
ncbi:MAG TPA: flagellar hook protein FlgE [Hyphomicrobiaceae bacterium]|nr:flagellar hook protein FlgE [Hyphomicrobiaceae bacterium]